MSFLTLVGLPVPVEQDAASKQLREIGGRARAFDGSSRQSVRTTKTEFTGLRTPPQTQVNADAYSGLIRGMGEVASFNVDTTTSRGTLASAVTNAARTTSSPAPKFGAGQLSVGATTGTISWDVGYTSTWTVLVYRYNTGTTLWEHYVVDSSARKWGNGVRNDAINSTWLTVTAGVVTLANTTGTAVPYEELVILPYLVIDTWPALLYAADAAWPALPDLNASGDMLSSALTVHGEASGGPLTSGAIDGVWTVNAQSLEFELRQV